MPMIFHPFKFKWLWIGFAAIISSASLHARDVSRISTPEGFIPNENLFKELPEAQRQQLLEKGFVELAPEQPEITLDADAQWEEELNEKEAWADEEWKSRSEIVAGADYRLLKQPQPSEVPPSKIEVIYFYHLGSNWTAAADPVIREWAKRLPVPVVFKPVPAMVEDNWAYLARLSLAFDHMGESAVIPKLLNHMHTQGAKFNPALAPDLREFISNQGISVESMAEALNANEVRGKIGMLDYVTRTYEVKTTPTLIIDGLFVIEAAPNRSPAEMLATATTIVEFLAEEKGIR